MKCVRFPNIDQPIWLNKDEIYCLSLESPFHFRELLNKIQAQINENEHYLYYNSGNKELDLAKDATLIINPYHMEIDEKKLSGIVQKNVIQQITQEQNEKFLLLVNALNDYVSEITYDYPLKVNYDQDISIQALLKTISLSVDSQFDSYLEYLIQQVKKYQVLLKNNLFIFVNLHDFLSLKELELFKKEMNYLEIDFFILQGHLQQLKLDQEFLINIDSDLCELHIESTLQRS